MRTVTFSSQNNLTLLFCGIEFFPSLLAAIEGAKNEILLETYIFAGDDAGQSIKEALVRAAGRGVEVNVITDWLGTGQAQAQILDKEFVQAKVNHRIFNAWFRRGTTRLHRKMCVVDREVAFVGGINFNDDLFSDDDSRIALPAPRWDFAIRIVGPLVNTIHLEMQAQWARLGKLNLVSRFEMFRQLRKTQPLTNAQPALAGLVVRDNLRNRRTIQRAYLHALGTAKKSALLASPYFAPGRRFRNALAAAAARGVEVTVLLGVGQFRMQDAVAHSFYPQLLKSGVKLVEYGKTQLHGKVAVIDEDWATVGSSNCDALSLFLNQEANVVIKDAAFSKTLRGHIEQGIVDGVMVKLEDFSHIPWYKRVWYEVAYSLYRAIIRLITLDNYD